MVEKNGELTKTKDTAIYRHEVIGSEGGAMIGILSYYKTIWTICLKRNLFLGWTQFFRIRILIPGGFCSFASQSPIEIPEVVRLSFLIEFFGKKLAYQPFN